MQLILKTTKNTPGNGTPLNRPGQCVKEQFFSEYPEKVNYNAFSSFFSNVFEESKPTLPLIFGSEDHLSTFRKREKGEKGGGRRVAKKNGKN